MSIHLQNPNLSIFFAPKVASSSLKRFAYEVVHGHFDLDMNKAGHVRKLHAIFPTLRFEKTKLSVQTDALKIAIVRDPIKRALSCYRDKVIKWKLLDNAVLESSDDAITIKGRPSFRDFVFNVDSYSKMNRFIRVHMFPQIHYIGSDVSYFDKIIPIQNISDVNILLRDTFGELPLIHHHNMTKGSDKNETDQRIHIQDDEREHLLNFYKKDYKVFGDFF